MFAAVAPTMINEATDAALRKAMRYFLHSEANRSYQERKQFKKMQLLSLSISDEQIDTCIVQMRALGLIKENDKKRSIKDVGTYWTMTPYGNSSMVQLRAVHREPVEEEILAGEATQFSGE